MLLCQGVRGHPPLRAVEGGGVHPALRAVEGGSTTGREPS